MDKHRQEPDIKEQYHVLIDNLAVGLAYVKVIFDDSRQGADLEVKEINHTLAVLLGLTREQCLGKTLRQIYPVISDTMAEILRALAKVAATGKPVQFDYLTDRTRIWVSASLHSPAAGYVVATIGDITERKMAEEALQESEAFNFNILNSSLNPILVSNHDDSIRYVNPALENLTGFSRTELLGRVLHYPWWTPEIVQRYMQDNINGSLEKTINLQKRHYCKKMESYFGYP
jgi:PAS domain S-box-containing protein